MRAGKHMPPKKKRGAGWKRRPERSWPAAMYAQAEQPAEDDGADVKHADTKAKPPKWRKLVDFARDLWASSYEAFFAAEDRERENTAIEPMPQTSYRARLKGAQTVTYDKKVQRRARKASGAEAHSQNMRAWTHSLLARSISWLNQRVPKRVWFDVERTVASRSSCLLLLEEMRNVEPLPPWTRSPHVFVVGADQTYMWQGAKKRGRGKQKAGEPARTGLSQPALAPPALAPPALAQSEHRQRACRW